MDESAICTTLMVRMSQFLWINGWKRGRAMRNLRIRMDALLKLLILQRMGLGPSNEEARNACSRDQVCKTTGVPSTSGSNVICLRSAYFEGRRRFLVDQAAAQDGSE